VWFVGSAYKPALNAALRWRLVTIGGFIAVLVTALGFVAGGHIQFKFFPEVEGDILTAKFELTQGVPFEQTERIARALEEAAITVGQRMKNREGEPVLKHVLASAGVQPFQTGFNPNGPPKATHVGEVTLELSPAKGRGLESDSKAIIAAWREQAGDLPGLVELTFRAETAAGGNAIDLNLTGGDLDRLKAATEAVKAGLARFDGVTDIADSNREGKDELQLIRLTPAGQALGLRLEDVARQVRDAFYGNEAQRLQRGRDEVKVMIRFPRDERRTLEALEEMKIRTRDGAEVPFRQVVEYEFGRGPAVINRTDRQRSVKITADVSGETNANQVMRGGGDSMRDAPNWLRRLMGKKPLTDEQRQEVDELAQLGFQKGVLDRLSSDFPGVRYGFEGEQQDQADSVREIGVGFIGAMVIMYVLIAIPLKSYWQPLIIMSVIPFGMIGAIGGHLLLGLNLSIMSMCGLVALAGVVVNDSLVLVDYVNRHRDESDTMREAAVTAGGRRFRAILLTSLTTFAGLMPMLLEDDVQARFLIPMAVSLGFGILFATVITLFLVPCVYLVLEDLRNLLTRRKRTAG